jgi:hypothetical protein
MHGNTTVYYTVVVRRTGNEVAFKRLKGDWGEGGRKGLP